MEEIEITDEILSGGGMDEQGGQLVMDLPDASDDGSLAGGIYGAGASSRPTKSSRRWSRRAVAAAGAVAAIAIIGLGAGVGASRGKNRNSVSNSASTAANLEWCLDQLEFGDQDQDYYEDNEDYDGQEDSSQNSQVPGDAPGQPDRDENLSNDQMGQADGQEYSSQNSQVPGDAPGQADRDETLSNDQAGQADMDENLSNDQVGVLSIDAQGEDSSNDGSGRTRKLRKDREKESKVAPEVVADVMDRGYGGARRELRGGAGLSRKVRGEPAKRVSSCGGVHSLDVVTTANNSLLHLLLPLSLIFYSSHSQKLDECEDIIKTQHGSKGSKKSKKSSTNGTSGSKGSKTGTSGGSKSGKTGKGSKKTAETTSSPSVSHVPSYSPTALVSGGTRPDPNHFSADSVNSDALPFRMHMQPPPTA